MERLSNKLGLDRGHLVHWCPACETHHRIPVNTGDPKDWKVSGTVNIPTINPSVKLSSGNKVVCHYILERGLLNYCNDTTHKYTNMVVPLPDLPKNYG